jgi:hypothetical protein
VKHLVALVGHRLLVTVTGGRGALVGGRGGGVAAAGGDDGDGVGGDGDEDEEEDEDEDEDEDTSCRPKKPFRNDAIDRRASALTEGGRHEEEADCEGGRAREHWVTEGDRAVEAEDGREEDTVATSTSE